MKQVAVRNLRLCTKDCLCLYVCPTGATDTEDSIIDVTKCLGCGVCADACPSGAISMVPTQYPPQQKKTDAVLAAADALANAKAEQETMARQLAGQTGKDGLYRLLRGVEKSVRLVSEDLLREAGYMLPQSENAHRLLKSWVQTPPSSQFPVQAARERTELEMEVSTPIFQLAFKGEAVPQGPDTLRVQLLGELAAQALVGTSSPLYARLYDQGLVNSEFVCGCELYPGCVFLCAGGESRDPDQVARAISEEARRLAREGIDPALWNRLKKAAYGERVRSLNSFESICVGTAQSFFAGADFFAFPDAFDHIAKEDAEALLGCWAAPERTTLSIVRPKGGQG